MNNKPLKIAFTGVYDIANYGDHLFPMIFDAVMKMKGINCKLYLFSPFGGQQSLALNETVYRLTDMESLHLEHQFDAIIVGGGGILHYASGRQKLTRESKEFLDYPVFETWVIPSIVAYKYNVKLIWNLPGGHQDFPDFYQELTQALCCPVDYLSVRDNYTKNILTDSGLDENTINVYPDSAFMMRECIPDNIIKDTLDALNIVENKYIIYHANVLLPRESIPDVIKTLDYFKNLGFEIILLPLAYTHDDESIFRKINEEADGRYTLFEKELNMFEIMSLLAGCYMYIGVSFHGAITAACHGKKSIAYDYVQNGKTRDLFKTLKQENYYVTDSTFLTECAIDCHNHMLPVDINEEISSLHEHFNKIIKLLTTEEKTNKSDKYFLLKFSSTISKINSTYDYQKYIAYNYELLKLEFHQLDELSRETHIRYVELQEKYSALEEKAIQTRNELGQLDQVSREKHLQFYDLEQKHIELQKKCESYQQQKIASDQWTSKFKDSFTYKLIVKINSIKQRFKK